VGGIVSRLSIILPIEDYTKYVMWPILAPYLINIRKLSDEKAFSIIKIGHLP
jgi:hypothetical protein